MYSEPVDRVDILAYSLEGAQLLVKTDFPMSQLLSLVWCLTSKFLLSPPNC